LKNKLSVIELVTAEHKPGSHVIAGCKMLAPVEKGGLSLIEVPQHLRMTLKRDIYKEIGRQA